MNKTVLKLGSRDGIEFVKIYRKHECLWNTEHALYKNRGARIAALEEFSREFGVEGYGPKEIKNKIKNLRSQYHVEKKKIKESMDGECSSSDVYIPKLAWFHLIDSFLLKTSEDREILSNSNEDSLLAHDNTPLEYNVDISEDLEELEDVKKFPTEILELSNVCPKLQTRKRPSTSYTTQPVSDPLQSIEKKPKYENKDDLDSFGNYITATLRTLNAKNCIQAQDEIQRILSKYKLRNLQDCRISSFQHTKQYSSPSDDDL